MHERRRIENGENGPHNQNLKRSDPVYLSSMTSHGVFHNQSIAQEDQSLKAYQEQQLELVHQQKLELQQRCCQNQALAEQLGGFVLPQNCPGLNQLMNSMEI